MGVPGPWYDRLGAFPDGPHPSAGKELQTEYLLPRQRAIEAILAVERLQDQVSPHLLISEIRTIAADDLWMSTCYQRPSVAIHFTWKPDWPVVRAVLPVVVIFSTDNTPMPGFNTTGAGRRRGARLIKLRRLQPSASKG